MIPSKSARVPALPSATDTRTRGRIKVAVMSRKVETLNDVSCRFQFRLPQWKGNGSAFLASSCQQIEANLSVSGLKSADSIDSWHFASSYFAAGGSNLNSTPSMSNGSFAQGRGETDGVSPSRSRVA